MPAVEQVLRDDASSSIASGDSLPAATLRAAMARAAATISARPP